MLGPRELGIPFSYGTALVQSGLIDSVNSVESTPCVQ